MGVLPEEERDQSLSRLVSRVWTRVEGSRYGPWLTESGQGDFFLDVTPKSTYPKQPPPHGRVLLFSDSCVRSFSPRAVVCRSPSRPRI